MSSETTGEKRYWTPELIELKGEWYLKTKLMQKCADDLFDAIHDRAPWAAMLSTSCPPEVVAYAEQAFREREPAAYAEYEHRKHVLETGPRIASRMLEPSTWPFLVRDPASSAYFVDTDAPGANEFAALLKAVGREVKRRG